MAAKQSTAKVELWPKAEWLLCARRQAKADVLWKTQAQRSA
jgi:hypothetical protein